MYRDNEIVLTNHSPHAPLIRMMETAFPDSAMVNGIMFSPSRSKFSVSSQ
ncbi:hypothetical protein CBFG_03064 [Clostridiales bacterium 1_7_47FAA]|nr:hypothetical protein CBFG_03064 [Clostridiales bacterium 1_7_47FAA]